VWPSHRAQGNSLIVAKVAGSGSGDGKASGRAKPRQGSPLPPPGGSRVGPRKFLREAWGELRKVQWPTRQQVATGTLIVAVVTAFFATYISVVDQASVRIVRQLTDHLLK
jgi:preprotein translocase subunit SecE